MERLIPRASKLTDLPLVARLDSGFDALENIALMESEGRLRRVMRVVERTIEANGQAILTPSIEIEGWWAALEAPEEGTISPCADHATREQFDSELKSDLELERLPSGKLATSTPWC